MTCTTAHQLIQEALDLPGSADPGLDSHLAGCGACRSYAEGMRRLVRDLESTAPERAPSVLMDRLGLAANRRAGAGRRWLPLGIVAAGLLIVTGLGPRLQQLTPMTAPSVVASAEEATADDLLSYFDPGESPTVDPLGL